MKLFAHWYFVDILAAFGKASFLFHCYIKKFSSSHWQCSLFYVKKNSYEVEEILRKFQENGKCHISFIILDGHILIQS